MGFFKSFFSGKSDSPANEKQKNEQKNFEIFKYDGMRAQRMGRTDYAIKCFTEALAIQEDFETMGYLAQVYTQTSELDEAHKLLQRMTEIEPEHTSTYLSLANVCYMQEDYPAMAGAAKKAIEIEEDGIMCIAHLTKAIVLKDDFIEARLLRAEALVQMQQYKEAMEDIDTILAQDPEDESAILLRGKIEEATGNKEKAESSYQKVTELNPFNEQAFLYLGQLYITQNKLAEAIELFTEATELNPNFAEAYHERGRAKLLNGDKEGSAEDMKKGLELNPKEIQNFNGQYGNQPGGSTGNILGL